jgi:hypothetical protein
MATRTYSLGGGGLSRGGGSLSVEDSHNFEISVNAFVKALNLNFVAVLKSVAVELRNRIMQGNPVDTGRSRDSWQLTVGQPSKYAPPLPWGRDDRRGANWPPPAPDASLAAIIDGTKTIFIVSNVPYVEGLEAGTSRQAPHGFIRLAAQSITSEMDQITARARAGESFGFTSANRTGFSTSAPPAHSPRNGWGT